MSRQPRGEQVGLVLNRAKTIRGEERPEAFLMLVGFCRENVTAKDLSKAIQLGEVEVVTRPTEEEGGSAKGET